MALGAAGLLTVVFGFLSLLLYNRTGAGVVRKHSQVQQLLSQLAVIALEQRVDSHVHAVESLSATLRQMPEEEWEQHFVLERGTISREIPFGFSLPHGDYVVHVDAVAEVAPTNAIYRGWRQQGPMRVE